MTIVALLTTVATMLVGSHVPVYCNHPPGIQWDGDDGFALWPPNRIYLRRCLATAHLNNEAVITFAHELIHIEHHGWPHWKVYLWDNWYANHVVRRKIKEVKLNEQ